MVQQSDVTTGLATLGASGWVTTPGFTAAPTGLVNRKWLRARARVASKSGNAKIIVLGNSVANGFGSAGAYGARGGSWPTQLAAKLTALGFPANANSICGIANAASPANYAAINDTRLTFGANWVINNQTSRQTLGGQAFSNASASTAWAAPDANTIQFAVTQNTFNAFDVYAFGGAANSLTVAVDAGAAISTTDLTNGSVPGLIKISAACSLATHTIDVHKSVGAGQSDVVAISCRNTTVPDIEIINAGITGSFASNVYGGPQAGWDYINTAGGPYPWERPNNPINALTTFVPDLVILALNINDMYNGGISSDAGTFQTALQKIITACQASADLLMIVEHPLAISLLPKATQNAFQQMVRNLAASNAVPLIDMAARWSSYEIMSVAPSIYFDTIHPNALGYNDYANIVASALTA